MADVHRAFLRAILEDPLSDVHRLVFADWIEENGGPAAAAWAEVIRLQCRQAVVWDHMRRGKAAGGGHGHRSHRALRRCARCRATRLRLDHLFQKLRQWPAEEEPLTPGPFIAAMANAKFYSSRPVAYLRRGFVEVIEVSTGDFFRHAEMIFAAAPVLAVTLTDRRPRQRTSGDCCWDDGPGGTAGSLPAGLLEIARAAMTPERGHCLPDTACFVFRGPAAHADATTALSRWCVQHGRKVAGLPGLQESKT